MNAELKKLDAYLTEKGVRHESKIWNKWLSTGTDMIVVLGDGGEAIWDATCHTGTYGFEDGLLEIYGQNFSDACGYLTAEEVIEMYESGFKDLLLEEE